MAPLRIHIGSIGEAGATLEERVEARQLPLLSAVGETEQIRFPGPVDVRIHAAVAGESILIEGRVRTVVNLVCSRCLEPFEWTIESDFRTTALPAAPPMEADGTHAEIELAADDMDAIAYQGEMVDLREEIGQQLLMALPIKALCRETCRGLCSRCGADLNRSPCRCRQEDGGNPFAVLKTLTLPSKKD